MSEKKSAGCSLKNVLSGILPKHWAEMSVLLAGKYLSVAVINISIERLERRSGLIEVPVKERRISDC